MEDEAGVAPCQVSKGGSAGTGSGHNGVRGVRQAADHDVFAKPTAVPATCWPHCSHASGTAKWSKPNPSGAAA